MIEYSGEPEGDGGYVLKGCPIGTLLMRTRDPYGVREWGGECLIRKNEEMMVVAVSLRRL